MLVDHHVSVCYERQVCDVVSGTVNVRGMCACVSVIAMFLLQNDIEARTDLVDKNMCLCW